MVYIFDCRTAEGTLLPFRVPTLVARIICCVVPFHDYAPTPAGF